MGRKIDELKNREICTEVLINLRKTTDQELTWLKIKMILILIFMNIHGLLHVIYDKSNTSYVQYLIIIVN
jgi:hypothetical protein